MRIDGWDISNADARQWNVTPGFHSVKNESEWSRGSPEPVLMDCEIGFKPITIGLLVKKEGGRQKILARCSDILSRLLRPVELELDGFEHNFYGVLTKHSHAEKVKERWHVLTLTFDVYEHAKTEFVQTFSGSMNISIVNDGNIITPATIEVTPQIGAASIKMTGICRDKYTGEDLPVEIRNLIAGESVILNGVDGIMTQAGALKAGDVDIWGVPSLIPGANKITVNNNRMDIKVKFYPRYM